MAIETHNTEFKRVWKDEYLKQVCGFANAAGGELYIGLDDDGTVVGVQNPKKLMEDIPNQISSILGIVADVRLLTEDGKDYICIGVSSSSFPVSYHGKHYIRSGATLQELSGIAQQDFIMKKMGLSWDGQAVPNATIDDIDPEAIKYFVRNGIQAKRLPESAINDSIETILKNRKLIDANGRLTLAALLLFGKDPRKFCFTCGIKVGMFGPGYSDLDNQNYIEGNLIQIVDKVVDLLEQMYLIHPIHYERLHRIETLEFPIEGLREILYNAVVHKDYRGPEITVRVFKDRVRIANEGNLPKEISIDSLYKSHESKPRNELIAGAFYTAGFIEAWGRGYEKIKTAFEAENLELPKVYEEGGFFCVEIKRERYIVISGYDKVMEYMKGVTNETNPEASKGDVTNNVTNGVDGTINVTKELSERQRDILKFLAINANVGVNRGVNHGAINSTIISENLGISPRTLTREMKALVDKGLIQWVGTRRSGHWEIVRKDHE